LATVAQRSNSPHTIGKHITHNSYDTVAGYGFYTLRNLVVVIYDFVKEISAAIAVSRAADGLRTPLEPAECILLSSL
jgi:hypothetical protein